MITFPPLRIKAGPGKFNAKFKSLRKRGTEVILSLSDRYEIFTAIWLWIDVCQNVVLSKIDITMVTKLHD